MNQLNLNISVTEDGVMYFTIYEVHGVSETGDITVIQRYTTKEKAEEACKFWSNFKAYKYVYPYNQIVFI